MRKSRFMLCMSWNKKGKMSFYLPKKVNAKRDNRGGVIKKTPEVVFYP